jgi:hypothetical protein
MTAYWIGEHAINDFTKFEEYLRKVVPEIFALAANTPFWVGCGAVLEPMGARAT